MATLSVDCLGFFYCIKITLLIIFFSICTILFRLRFFSSYLSKLLCCIHLSTQLLNASAMLLGQVQLYYYIFLCLIRSIEVDALSMWSQYFLPSSQSSDMFHLFSIGTFCLLPTYFVILVYFYPVGFFGKKKRACLLYSESDAGLRSQFHDLYCNNQIQQKIDFVALKSFYLLSSVEVHYPSRF